jgi:hypothetical protein
MWHLARGFGPWLPSHVGQAPYSLVARPPPFCSGVRDYGRLSNRDGKSPTGADAVEGGGAKGHHTKAFIRAIRLGIGTGRLFELAIYSTPRPVD